MAARDGRDKLGGDIMIHGNSVSIGCLAMGNEVAEDFFVLAADVSLPKIKVIITPVDFRKGSTLAAGADSPPWLPHLYGDITRQLSAFKAQM